MMIALTLLIATLQPNSGQVGPAFDYTIKGGETHKINGKLWIAAGLLEPLGYRVQAITKQGIKVTGPGGSKVLPTRKAELHATSENTSDCVPLDALSKQVRGQLNLVRGADFVQPTNAHLPYLRDAILATFRAQIAYSQRSLSKRRWFALDDAHIRGVSARVRLIGLTVGHDNNLLYRHKANKEPVPAPFVSVELILSFDRRRQPAQYVHQGLPVEAFALRCSDGGVFQPNSLMFSTGIRHYTDGSVSSMGLRSSVGPNPDRELATAVTFWIPADRTPTELVYCDGRAISRSRLKEIKGPTVSMDPIAYGQDVLSYIQGAITVTRRYEEIFKS